MGTPPRRRRRHHRLHPGVAAIGRSLGEGLFESLPRGAHQINEEAHVVLFQGGEGLLDVLRAKSQVVDPDAIVVDELLRGAGLLVSDVR